MSKIKTYFKDYAEAQKVCNAFQRKHRLGNFIVVAVVWVLHRWPERYLDRNARGGGKTKGM